MIGINPMNRKTSAKGKSRKALKKAMQASTVSPERTAIARGADVTSPSRTRPRPVVNRVKPMDSAITIIEDRTKSCGAA